MRMVVAFYIGDSLAVSGVPNTAYPSRVHPRNTHIEE